jgi:hypothetical protein
MAPKANKRRTVSGIGHEEVLVRVYQELKKMNDKFEYEEVAQDQPLSLEAELAEGIASLMEKIETQVKGIKVHIHYLYWLLPSFLICFRQSHPLERQGESPLG